MFTAYREKLKEIKRDTRRNNLGGNNKNRLQRARGSNGTGLGSFKSSNGAKSSDCKESTVLDHSKRALVVVASDENVDKEMNDSSSEHQSDTGNENENGDMSFLESVYLQKTTYRIRGKIVEQTEDVVYKPVKFKNSI